MIFTNKMAGMVLVTAKSQYKEANLKKQQAGVVLIVTLIALVIMLLASVALIRSTDTNLLIAGNMAFKRDLINQAERVIPQIKTRLSTGALSSESAKQTDLTTQNYYATTQASNASGIPNVLLALADNNTNNIVDASLDIRVRYVIDRMCLDTGEATESKCTLAGSSSDGNGQGVLGGPKSGGVNYPVYRITLWATGPRNTQAYVQTTYSNE
jgi:type IV pilus assembly protein PilX